MLVGPRGAMLEFGGALSPPAPVTGLSERLPLLVEVWAPAMVLAVSSAKPAVAAMMVFMVCLPWKR